MASASDLNRGMAFEYKGEVLKVVRREVVAVGTHSHTKLKFFVKPLYGGGEKTLSFAHNDKVDVVTAEKKVATVVAIMPDAVQIMDSQTYECFDASVAPDVKAALADGDTVIYVNYKGKVAVIEKDARFSRS